MTGVWWMSAIAVGVTGGVIVGLSIVRWSEWVAERMKRRYR